MLLAVQSDTNPRHGGTAKRSPATYRLPLWVQGRDILRGILPPFARLIGTTRDDLTRFVIFGQGRTGSTLLSTLLNSSPLISCRNELLKKRRLFPLEHLDYYARRSSKAARAFGFHLKPWHITRVLGREPIEFMRQLESAGYRFVHLERRNIFLHALSQVKRSAYDIVHAREAGERPSAGFAVDTKSLIRVMKSKDAAHQLEEACLASLRRGFIGIEYAADLLYTEVQQATCRKICRFLEVDHVGASSPLIRVSPLDWRTGVTNPEEIESAVAAAGFESFIEEADVLAEHGSQSIELGSAVPAP